jgi:DNA (cytosine-5)-methyltransferase 1
LERDTAVPKPRIAGIDLFCGVGGLTYGLQKAGIDIVAGIDLDPACEFPFTENNKATFIRKDIRDLTGDELLRLYPKRCLRLLAGCAPCRPFSPFLRGANQKKHKDWGLLGEFSRLVMETKPDLVTMENVPGLASKAIFRTFVSQLRAAGYDVDARSVYCPTIGIPQQRRRLVLMASRIGPITVPLGDYQADEYVTVRNAIGHLPRLSAGDTDSKDALHRARHLTQRNLERLQASRPGGTWRDWPKELRSRCHRKKSGASYKSVYARMSWDEPSPTITTQAYNFGTGRFGHPDQDRAITLREAAILQTFPPRYRFVGAKQPIFLATIGRLIGNAVPPLLGLHVGRELMRVAACWKVMK